MEEKADVLKHKQDERNVSGINKFDSAGRRDAEINEASIDIADNIESEDDSMLVPSEGIKRLYIKAIVKESLAVDESHPLPDSDSEDYD